MLTRPKAESRETKAVRKSKRALQAGQNRCERHLDKTLPHPEDPPADRGACEKESSTQGSE